MQGKRKEEGGAPIVRVSDLKRLLGVIPSHRALMIWGPPGVGKSDGVRQYCADHGLKLYDVRLSQLDPIDLRGIGVPDMATKQCVWFPPKFLPQPNEKNTVLFLDEINSAPPSVQAAGYQLILDRRVGETCLPKDCRIIAAGNRESDRGVTFRMPSPLANRFIHAEVKPDIYDWMDWAFRNNVNPNLIAFLLINPTLLHDMSADNSGSAWPSPRSWAFVAEIMGNDPDKKKSLELTRLAVSAAVGMAPALAYLKFLVNEENQIPPANLIWSQDDYKQGRPLSSQEASSLAVLLGSMCPQEEKAVDRVCRFCTQLPEEMAYVAIRALEERFGLGYVQSIAGYSHYLSEQDNKGR